MSQRIPKILIISSDTGGGHRSAAAAIVAGVQKFFEASRMPSASFERLKSRTPSPPRWSAIYNWCCETGSTG